MLYEATGDLNNAFIAYRKAYDIYDATKSWARTPMPPMLRADFTRDNRCVHMTTEFEEYRRLFPETRWLPRADQQNLAQVVVIGYNGRAPRKEDAFLDIPISLSALQLVLLNRGVIHASNRQAPRGGQRVVWLEWASRTGGSAKLIPQKTQVVHETVTLIPRGGEPISATSELVYNGTALAERSLSDRLPGITTKALARAAVNLPRPKPQPGSQHAVNKGDAPWVGLLVGVLAWISRGVRIRRHQKLAHLAG